MKDDGQSRKAAINLMTDPISSKESCMIGTWNVRTMNESTKTAQIIKEMTSYNLGILGIAECRWTGQGQTITKDGHLILALAMNVWCSHNYSKKDMSNY